MVKRKLYIYIYIYISNDHFQRFDELNYMCLIAETMEQLQLMSFFESNNDFCLKPFENIEKLNILMTDPNKNQVEVINQWNDCLEELNSFEDVLEHIGIIL